MIRVLVVEDSATARSLLVQILRTDPELAIVGEAKDGLDAVAQAQRLRPDVITMDVDMPQMDGFAATKEIMITVPTPIVIVSGSRVGREADLAVQALRAGAVAVLDKPPGWAAADFDDHAAGLVRTVKAMAGVKVIRRWRTTERPMRRPTVRRAGGKAAAIVAIAASTGGPAAIQTVLAAQPAHFPLPILVVQHITPGYGAALAHWLNAVCDLRVKIAESGEPLRPATVYVAPDDRHLGVAEVGRIALSDAPAMGGFRPSATFLFESVARVFRDESLAVVLTGMGDDGVEGLRAVRQAGGRIAAQDEQSCVVFGMPRATIEAGLADTVLHLDDIAGWLTATVSDNGRGAEG